jgi:hypothetical protein
MERSKISISPEVLYARLGSETAPIIVDVRRDADISGVDRLVADAFHCSPGLSANFPDDHEILKHGTVIHDALYTWCRTLQTETHNWPAGAVGA